MRERLVRPRSPAFRAPPAGASPRTQRRQVSFLGGKQLCLRDTELHKWRENGIRQHAGKQIGRVVRYGAISATNVTLIEGYSPRGDNPVQSPEKKPRHSTVKEFQWSALRRSIQVTAWLEPNWLR